MGVGGAAGIMGHCHLGLLLTATAICSMGVQSVSVDTNVLVTGCKNDAWNGVNQQNDPADTSVGQRGREDPDGKTRKVVASGVVISTNCIPGVGKVRTRYNIMPIHEEGSTTWKELKALEKLIEKHQIPSATMKYMEGPNVTNNAWHECALFLGTLDEAKAKCNEDPTCQVLHDWNCDGYSWRYCPGRNIEALRARGSDTKSCTKMKEETNAVFARNALELQLSGGTANHQHKVVLTADQQRYLHDGVDVEVRSTSVEGHSHRVQISAAEVGSSSDWAYSLDSCQTGSNVELHACSDGHNKVQAILV